MRAGRGGGGDSAERRMGEGAERRGAGSPEDSPICPLLEPAGPLGVESEACGTAVTQPMAASSASSRGRASPAPALCPCPRHPAAPCRSASRPRCRETSLGAAGAAAVPCLCHPNPSTSHRRSDNTKHNCPKNNWFLYHSLVHFLIHPTWVRSLHHSHLLIGAYMFGITVS